MDANVLKEQINYIDNQPALDACVTRLRGASELAFDLEFDSHSFTYGVNLALIQIADPERCFLIDPLVELDLNDLFAVFEDAAIRKLAHSSGEDLRLLHSLGCVPQNVYDTEVAARLLNYEFTSLAAMLQAKLGIQLDKKQQRSNWLKRPLTEEQLHYAALDVQHLHALKAALEPELAAANLLEFTADEQAALSRIVHQPEERTTFLRPADSHQLSPHDQYVLDGLLRFRDELAREMNRPAFQILDEQLLRALTAGDVDAEDVPFEKGVHGRLKNAGFGRKVRTRYERLLDDAERDGLSRNLPERRRLSKEEHAARQQAEADRKDKFGPVQEALAARYGTFAARMLLSNTLVGDVLRGATRLEELQRPYRLQVIRDLAAGLGISLEPYL
jgi:ribonuclease D